LVPGEIRAQPTPPIYLPPKQDNGPLIIVAVIIAIIAIVAVVAVVFLFVIDDVVKDIVEDEFQMEVVDVDDFQHPSISPDAGYRFVRVDVRMEADEGSSLDLHPNMFTLVTDAGEDYEYRSGVGNTVPDLLGEGDTEEFFMVFEIPEDEDPVRLEYDFLFFNLEADI
jgi:hypothetical protein